ncbi:MAG: radical SAM protein [Candidatus Omnitrophica bacterium]|nr:radical SAM protein [Candidatus Omnitrophota bacterium]
MRIYYPKLLIADKRGRIFDVPFFEAAGMAGGEYFRLSSRDLIKLPADSELFMLPGRSPVGFDPDKRSFVRIENNPLIKKKESCYAVAAFLAPGYTTTYSAAYAEPKKTKKLPLFSYAAAVLYKNEFYAAGVRVDKEKRQELRGMDIEKVRKNVKLLEKVFPKNRLVRHLETCALTYGCPAAKNFFLKRYEGPLPSSPFCNARCLGCISHQPGSGCSISQPRIKFVPTAEEIATIALFHIQNVREAIVSFGQGCEGEPLMVGETLEKAIKLIRKKTSKGVINLNTNASKPDVLSRLFRAGLDSIRVSVNSFQEEYYRKYYKPKDYTFKEVAGSIKTAKKNGAFVSLNYLVMPGFTDSEKEVNAFRKFLNKQKIDMIQWRNLNYDPILYFKELGIKPGQNNMIGVGTLIRKIKKDHLSLMHGYFNPSRRRISGAQCGVFPL